MKYVGNFHIKSSWIFIVHIFVHRSKIFNLIDYVI